MSRVLIGSTAIYISGRILRNTDELLFDMDDDLTLADVLHDMIGHLVRFNRAEDVSIGEFMDSFLVIPLVQILNTGRSSADTGDRVKSLQQIDLDLIESTLL